MKRFFYFVLILFCFQLFSCNQKNLWFNEFLKKADEVSSVAAQNNSHVEVLFNKAVDLDPRYAAAHAALGEAHLRLYRLTRKPVDLDLAQRFAERAIAIDDTRPGASGLVDPGGPVRFQRRRAISSADNSISVAARLSCWCRWCLDMGIVMTRLCMTSQARAICCIVASWARAIALSSRLALMRPKCSGVYAVTRIPSA